MKVDVSTVGSFQKRIDCVVPPAEVATKLEAAYRKLSGKVRLPGFRPGKAPRKILEARFGPQIEAEVAQDIVQQSFRTVLVDHEIDAVGQPALAESSPVADANGFKFTITVDVKPSVELSKWTGLDVVYPEVSVADAEIDASVKSRLEGQAKLEEVTGRPIQKGDLALVELTVTDGDQTVASEPGTMIRTEGDPYYPGIEAFLVGLDAGAEKEGKVTFASDARTEAVAGRELDTKVKVLSLQTYRVPEATDELATELGFEGGVSGMREAMAARIRTGRDEMARNQARANLLEALIAVNTFDVPAGMVEQSLKMLMDELRMQQAVRSGRDPRTIGFNDAQVRDLRMRAEFAAKASLILEWVTKREHIEVTDADLERKYRELADQRGQTIEAVKGWFQKEDAIDEFKARILEEKTLDWLLERANLVAPSAVKTPAAAESAPAEEPKKSKKKKEAAAPAAEEAPAAEATDAAPKAAKAKAKAEAPADDAGAADTSILDGKIDALKEALASGAHDAQLDALLAAETGGRNRKGAVSAIEARKAEVQG